MARIAGVLVPDQKHVVIALTAIHGIGRSRSREICEKLNIAPHLSLKRLSELDLDRIRQSIAEYTVEGELKRQVMMSIKRLMDMGCYRGIRHRRGLPVRGQRTHTNARTRRGASKGVKKASSK